MNSSSTQEPRHPLKVSTLTGTLIILLATTVLFIIFGAVCRQSNPAAMRLICMTNLKGLGQSLYLYANENASQFPPADRWCDALTDNTPDMEPKLFRCPGVETGPCNYAMNPNVDPNDPGDVVLLFETEPGWNQAGGAELLTVENHKRKGKGDGCCVLFVDGRVEYIKSDRIDDLKWNGQDRDIQGS